MRKAWPVLTTFSLNTMGDEADSLDMLLYECTQSTNHALDADRVAKFCSAVEKDLDGPSTAARLLGHKIQSPQQHESLNALSVTDECIKKCGRRFQDEIGKFRFLNEIIKMISPKYFGDKTSPKVKTKCIELLYKWSIDLRHEPKILDAYEMLKRQGIIEDDPILGDSETNGDVACASTAKAAAGDDKNNSIFDDEDKSKLLARLLSSKHPDDLQAANRLIKNMVKQDEEKQEKISQRYNLLETVRNNVKLLSEMLDCYQMAGGTSTSDKDIIKELFKNIEQERPKLFKLASDTEGSDSDGMSQVLQVNDEVVQVSQRYKQVVDQGDGDSSAVQKETAPPSNDLAGLELAGAANADLFSSFEGAPESSPAAPGKNAASSILDLFSAPTQPSAPPTMQTQLAAMPPLLSAPTSSSSFPATTRVATVAPAPLFPTTASKQTSNLDELFTFNTSPALAQPAAATAAPALAATAPAVSSTPDISDDIGLLSLDSGAGVTAGLAAPLLPANDSLSLFDTSDTQADEPLFDNNKKSALEDLDFLGQDLLQKTKPTQQVVQATPAPSVPVKQSLNQLKATNVEKSLTSSVPVPQPIATVPVAVHPLTNIHVPITAVKPGELPPLSVYEKDAVKLVIHFAQNKPREDVQVMVISITSTKDVPIKSVIFQAAVPKSMKVKLQPPSATELPAYNPILPPSAITQIMLLANPNKEKVKLKYKLAYSANGYQQSDTGDVVNFPL